MPIQTPASIFSEDEAPWLTHDLADGCEQTLALPILRPTLHKVRVPYRIDPADKVAGLRTWLGIVERGKE